MKELLEKNNITLYSTENKVKSIVCEKDGTVQLKSRCGSSLQSRVIPYIILPKILEQYNNTEHSSIKMTPIEASKKKNRMKEPCILTYMVIWSNCHLSLGSRLVTKSG